MINNPHATLGNRTALGGLGQSGIRLNQGAHTSLNQGAHTALRPGGTTSTALNARTATGAGALHVPFAGRVTPQHLNSFLAMPNRAGAGGLAGTNVRNISHLGGHTNVNHTNINNSFNRLNVTQVNRINNNLNTGFRHHHGFNRGFGFNNGFGFNSFGFGWGNPFFYNWGLGITNFWNPYGYYGLFGNRFWATNYAYFPYSRYSYYGAGYPYSYWWGTPSWGGLNSWFPSYGWNTPYYYGYGPGGNIVYNNGTVYMDDVPIATAADYAASAATLAEVPTPANPDQPTQWLPLGTFVLSENEADKDPARVVQLAVDKDGIISGTMYNKTTKQTFPIQGRVDKETQRVAFTIGDAKDVVFETGIYNLTQQQTPILAHGDGREETYLLVRLQQPNADGSAATPSTTVAPAPSPATVIPDPAPTTTPAPTTPAPTTPIPPGPSPIER